MKVYEVRAFSYGKRVGTYATKQGIKSLNKKSDKITKIKCMTSSPTERPVIFDCVGCVNRFQQWSRWRMEWV